MRRAAALLAAAPACLGMMAGMGAPTQAGTGECSALPPFSLRDYQPASPLYGHTHGVDVAERRAAAYVVGLYRKQPAEQPSVSVRQAALLSNP
eukprot:gene700-4878_t